MSAMCIGHKLVAVLVKFSLYLILILNNYLFKLIAAKLYSRTSTWLQEVSTNDTHA